MTDKKAEIYPPVKTIIKADADRLAKILLSNPNTSLVFTFGTEGEPETWYEAVCVRILEPFTILINECNIFGGSPMMIDLPCYAGYYEDHEYLGKPVPSFCLQEATEGLKNYINKHGGGKTVYINTTDLIKIKLTHKRITEEPQNVN